MDGAVVRAIYGAGVVQNGLPDGDWSCTGDYAAGFFALPFPRGVGADLDHWYSFLLRRKNTRRPGGASGGR